MYARKRKRKKTCPVITKATPKAMEEERRKKERRKDKKKYTQ